MVTGTGSYQETATEMGQAVLRELQLGRAAQDALERAQALGLWVLAREQAKVVQAQAVRVVLAVNAWVLSPARAAEVLSPARAELAAGARGQGVARLERACQGNAESAD